MEKKLCKMVGETFDKVYEYKCPYCKDSFYSMVESGKMQTVGYNNCPKCGCKLLFEKEAYAINRMEEAVQCMKKCNEGIMFKKNCIDCILYVDEVCKYNLVCDFINGLL